MLLTSFDLLSSTKMSILQSTVYDSYASNLSLYSVRTWTSGPVNGQEYSKRIFLYWIFSAPPIKWRDIILNYVTNVSFHMLASSLFTVIQLLHPI